MCKWELSNILKKHKMKKSQLKQIIQEEIKNFIKEVEGGGLIDISAGPEAVLKAAAKIPQNILKSGDTDAKGPNDEKIKITSKTVKAKDMIPTQKEIGSGQSLDDQIKDKFGNLDRALKGGMLASKSGQFPILTYGGKYILDGHHRWSQFLASNPDATVKIADISAPGVNSPKEALALAHVILLALYGKSPTKPFEGENLIQKNAEWVKKYVSKNIVDSALKKLVDAKKIAKADKELAGDYYANNLFGEPGKYLSKGVYSRTVMPQGADAGDKSGLTKAPADAAAGKVNYLNPVKSDVKESKRWQKLAGIIK